MTRAASQHSAAADLVANLRAGDQLSKPETELRELLTELIDEGVEAGELLTELIDEGVEAGELRDDVPPAELALYCLNAAAGARHAESKAAVRRMLDVAMTGLVKTARD